jgi:hypothetical protein
MDHSKLPTSSYTTVFFFSQIDAEIRRGRHFKIRAISLSTGNRCHVLQFVVSVFSFHLSKFSFAVSSSRFPASFAAISVHRFHQNQFHSTHGTTLLPNYSRAMQ